jgi:hypothetical protein
VKFVRIVGHVEHTTPDALLMKCGRDNKLWIPRGVVRNGDVATKGDIQIEVSEAWLTEKKETWWIARGAPC